MSDTLTRICDWLTGENVVFRLVHHEPTPTSEDSARARGEDLRVGGKALVMRGDEKLLLCVLPADLKADSGAIRRQLGIKNLRFISRNELVAATGLESGSVPPFGPPILPFPLYADETLTGNDRIAFNAGSLTDSIIMPMVDYLRIAQPTVFKFSQG